MEDKRVLMEKELEKVTGGAADFKKSFNVILCAVGTNKIAVIRELKAMKTIGIKEVNAILAAVPVVISESVLETQAIAEKRRLESAGATIELKEHN